MWIDKLNEFDVTETALTVTAPSTNVLDLGSDRDIGNGEEMEIVFTVGAVAFVAAGAATLVVAAETDSVAGFGTKTILAQSDVIPKASLIPGFEVLRIKAPFGIKQFLRLNYTVATGPFTAGTFRAFLTKDRQAWRSFPSGYSLP